MRARPFVLVTLGAVLGCGSAPSRTADERPSGGWAAATACDSKASLDAPRSPSGEGIGRHPELRGRAQSIAPRLKGGEVDDNDRWDEYLRYRAELAGRVEGEVQPIDVEGRIVVRVVDSDGRPASGARVIVRDATGRALARRTCYADGRTLFFPRAEGNQEDEWVLEAQLADGRARKLVARGSDHVTLRLDDVRRSGRPALDVVFCLDTTGSMGDEIEAMKRTIDDVVRRLEGLPGHPYVRLGLVRFRDRGDEYVVQSERLTNSLGTFRSYLARTVADGGGDTPEDVQAGLAAAIEHPDWDDAPTAARLVFLIGDAAPHLYRDQASYATTLRRAAERGIKCFSLAASGLDDAGEYAWRQVAQTTLGRFIFVSYGTPSGERGTPHHVGPYLENDLDAIVVRCCAREVEALGTFGRGQQDE